MYLLEKFIPGTAFVFGVWTFVSKRERGRQKLFSLMPF